MKPKLYLDTSIPSAYFDTSKPVRQLITQQWFINEARNFDLYISVVTIEEIDKIVNQEKKENIKKLVFDNNMNILELNTEMLNLSEKYISNGAIPSSEPEDALHVSIATVREIEYLASWNFKHIVSVNPIRKIHEISRNNNYIIIEIGTLEIFGGSKYGNL